MIYFTKVFKYTVLLSMSFKLKLQRDRQRHFTGYKLYLNYSEDCMHLNAIILYIKREMI
jgi:hypothetical protein